MLLINRVENEPHFPQVKGFLESLRWTNYGGQFHRRQFGYANVSVHRGVTNLPKGGVFFVIEKVWSEHLEVRVISTDPTTNGRVFQVSKRLTTRINITERWFLMHDCEELQVRLREFLTAFCSSPNGLNLYLRRAEPGRYKTTLARIAEEDPRNQTRAVGWLTTYGRRLEFWVSVRAVMKILGNRNAERLRRVACLKARLDADASEVPASDVRALHTALGYENNSISNRWRCVSDYEREFIMKLRADLAALPGLHTTTECGHWSWDSDTQTIPGRAGRYCARCYKNEVETYGPIIQAIDETGRTVPCLRKRAFEWFDGSLHTYKEPPVVGQYHSSAQQLASPLPHITGAKVSASELKVGFELEFVHGPASVKSDANYYARLMRSRFEEVTKPILGEQPWALFEYDGSVDWEMVTGYGPLDIHRAAVIALLGGRPFGNEVLSHNGGRCGLHVHLDKPKSLMHAVRLQAFYNNPMNEKLVRAVARRYSGQGYAKVKGEKGNMLEAAKHAQYYKPSYGRYDRAMLLRQGIDRLNSDRYELVNFTPARTVEIRAFRGSMVCETVIACLEFAYMSWYFARDTPADELTTPNFLSFISAADWRHQTQYLRAYLKARGFKVWVPIGKKTLSTQEA